MLSQEELHDSKHTDLSGLPSGGQYSQALAFNNTYQVPNAVPPQKVPNAESWLLLPQLRPMPIYCSSETIHCSSKTCMQPLLLEHVHFR